MSNEGIEIRDLRQQDWVWTAKALLYHPHVDASAYKTYGGLAAHADNKTQEAFPSISTLARKLHISRNTVIRSLKKLEDLEIIRVDRSKGVHNIYFLLDVPIPEAIKTPSETRVATKKTEAIQKTGPTAREFFGSVKMQEKVVEYLIGKGVAKSLAEQEVHKFVSYWTEASESGKQVRWEGEKYFDIQRRLGRWFKNAQTFAAAKRPSRVATIPS